MRGEALVEKLGEGACFLPLDLSGEGSWQAARGQVDAQGELRILVNCAGIMIPLDIESTDCETWNATLQTNAGGCLLGSRFGIAAMQDHGRPGVSTGGASDRAVWP